MIQKFMQKHANALLAEVRMHSNQFSNQPVATSPQLVFSFPKIPGNCSCTNIKSGWTGKHSPVATDVGPVWLPVFWRSGNRTLKHYLWSTHLPWSKMCWEKISSYLLCNLLGLLNPRPYSSSH